MNDAALPDGLPEKLPIDGAIADIIEKLRSNGAIVIKAEPGAGKTTRVPPAILDAGLAEHGMIFVLQPRRVAARSAAMRVADERLTSHGRELGKEIGYQVRQEGRHSRETRILFCTEGIFLRRLQDDPLLEGTAVVVFDEFHERSIDSDLALAMVRQVRADVRPDLQIVVMSATLDPEPISRYLGDCPTVECPGRTFPIAIDYLQFAPKASLPQMTADGVRQVLPQTEGHVLVFLPGVGEIRQCADVLIDDVDVVESGIEVMQLYGDMSLAEQQKVLQPSRHRKIILATNVAETSLTIEGVTAVVDAGMARVNRFHAQLGLNRLEMERISRASADQRAGRAGRTAPGRCLRLWTERDQQALSEFDSPEIGRVDLSQCLLQLIAWGEPDVSRFGWFEPPPPSAVQRAVELLRLTGALEGGNRGAEVSGGAITELGKQMAKLPLQPRLARLLIEGKARGVVMRAALCAALLSERDPFRRDTSPQPIGERGAGEQRDHGQYHRRTDSDLLDRVLALEEFHDTGTRQFDLGALSAGATKQVIRTAADLVRVLDKDQQRSAKLSSADDRAAEDIEVLRAIAAAFPDRVCRRRAARDKRALMVGGRGVRLSEESGVSDSEFFVAVELSDTGQSETLVRQASHIDRSWLPESHLTTAIDVSYAVDKQKVTALKRTRYVDLILDEVQVPVPPSFDAASILAQGITENLDAVALIDDQARNFIARVQCLREWLPELQLPELELFNPEPPDSASWLQEWCVGRTAVSELTGDSLIAVIRSRLTHPQLMALEQEAPEKIAVPSGRQHKLIYEVGKPPVLAVRIQELFGMSETPRIARNRVAVLLHLLAPNYRVQQITPDLANFWKNTYSQVRKDLKARYPKHAWPDNPSARLQNDGKK